MTDLMLLQVAALAEAIKASRRDIALGPSANRIRRALRTMWRDQRKATVAALRKKRSAFAEADTPPAWEADWNRIAAASARRLEVVLDAEYPRGLRTGARHAIADCAAEISFDVAHPDAVAWTQGRAATRVAAINEATRDSLRVLLANAIESGQSWTATAREIESMFAGFSGSVGQTYLRTRAELVAVTEMAEAYEYGQGVVRSDLSALGLAVEKQWLTVGDARVSGECRDNEAEGWIPNAASFGSGASAPPEHPGCRCSSLSRVNTEGA